MKNDSLLGYTLLGLIHEQPQSGYDLRKIFASTAWGTFSDSPGAIYPALRRLETAGQVCGTVVESATLRRRRVFRITPQGLDAFKAWLMLPVTRDDVISRIPDLMVRFAFMDRTVGEERTAEFLGEFAGEMAGYIPSLRQYLEISYERNAALRTPGPGVRDSGVRIATPVGQNSNNALRTKKEEPGMNLYWRIGLYCLLGGLCFTVSALGAGHFWLWWLSGVITVAALTPVARFGPRHPLALFGAIALPLVVVGLVCTLSEGVLFYPAMKAEALRDLMGGSVSYLIVAAVLVALAKLLKLTKPETQAVEHRRLVMAIPAVLAAGASYVVYYMIFGAIAFQFFTKQYYPHAVEQVAALGAWFWVYQWGRGTLMVLAVLPIIYTLRLTALAGRAGRGSHSVDRRGSRCPAGAQSHDDRHAALHSHRRDHDAERLAGRDRGLAACGPGRPL